MGFILWIVMGLIVGGVAGWVMRSSYPWYIDLLLGVVGAWLGGWLTSIFLGVDLTSGFNLTTFLVAAGWGDHFDLPEPPGFPGPFGVVRCT
jgi:uncharacterized membrane protein YeaQ/YmgE (transglycosylase-associated protein family)